MLIKKIREFDTGSLIILLVIIAVDIFIWRDIVAYNHFPQAHAYFLDVGQGDAEMIAFPGNIKVMTDAGPTDKVMDSLGKVLSPDDSYIDVAIISHPQLDHFNGYNYMLDHYTVGAFIYNGRDDDPGVKAWPQLLAKIKAKNIPLITLAAGDSIRYASNTISMLSPDKEFDQSAELNDTGFVEMVKTASMNVLLTADIGFNVEDFLIKTGQYIRADILKVGHHGSKYSTSDEFLKAVDPKLAVIEVGAGNTYGHPSPAALVRIASSSQAELLRTDKNGTIEAWIVAGKLHITREK